MRDAAVVWAVEATSVVDDALVDALTALPPISLDTLQETADLQTRVDRKYVLSPALAAALLRHVAPGARALEIDGAREFRYESVYFDTPELASYREAATGRRHRFKVRTRAYLDSGDCTLELKRRGGRDETLKLRLPYHLDTRDVVNDAGRDFLEREGLSPEMAARLAATLVTSYRRSTVVAAGVRLTIDRDLRCRRLISAGEPADAECGLAEGRVVVETKSPGQPTDVDRWLWAHGTRPVPLSKYCTGLAALTPGLAANKWHRTLGTYFRG